MSDIGVDYDLQYTPVPLGVDIAASIDGATARVTLQNAPRVLVTATPHYSSNIGSDIVSTIGTPLANSITATAGTFATEILQNKSFDVYTLTPISFSVAGATVQLQPGNLNLSAFNGMLMMTGDLSIH